MQSGMSKYADVKNNPISCTAGQDDDSVDDLMRVSHNLVPALLLATDSLTEKQAKRWGNAWKLDNHVNSIFHSRLGRWKREALQKAASHPKKRVTCPLCEAVGVSRTFRSVNLLVQHVRKATVNAQHEELKVEDGWYDDDFIRQSLNITRRKVRLRQEGKRRNTIDAAGHRISIEMELEVGISVEGRPSIIRGCVHEYTQPPMSFMTSILDLPPPPRLLCGRTISVACCLAPLTMLSLSSQLCRNG